LSALAWLVLGYDEDANDAIKQAYMLSKMPFVSKHRLILLNGLLVRQQVLLGKPISGRGAYGVLGAILSREPLESTTSVPRDLIIKIVDSYLQKNHTALLNRFFDYRAEQILPGVKGVVLEHLASLGIVVEDDGVPTPIVLFGTEVTALQSLFESSSRYQVQHVDYAMVEEILAIWQSYQEQSIEDFLFGDLSFLGDDAETDDKAQIVQQIRGIVEKGYTDPTKRLVLIWPTISDNASLIKEVYPNAVGVFYAADPRADIVQGTITTEKLHQVFTENYTTKSNFDSFVYVNEVQLEKDVSVRISEIFATLGEVYEPTMVDVWKNAYGESPSETYEFDEKTQAFLEKWKFVV
jgi:hypothetical protein